MQKSDLGQGELTASEAGGKRNLLNLSLEGEPQYLLTALRATNRELEKPFRGRMVHKRGSKVARALHPTDRRSLFGDFYRIAHDPAAFHEPGGRKDPWLYLNYRTHRSSTAKAARFRAFATGNTEGNKSALTNAGNKLSFLQYDSQACPFNAGLLSGPIANGAGDLKVGAGIPLDLLKDRVDSRPYSASGCWR